MGEMTLPSIMPAIGLCRDFFFPLWRDDVAFISDFNDWFGRMTRPHSLYPRRKGECAGSTIDKRGAVCREIADSLMRWARRHYSAISRDPRTGEERILAINRMKEKSRIRARLYGGA